MTVAVLGPAMVGFTFSTLLFGITTTQTYLYFTTFQKDRAGLKFYVGALWVCEFVFTIFETAAMYGESVTHFGDRTVWNSFPALFNLAIFLGSIVSFISQAFFIYRVWKTTRRLSILLVLVVLSFIRLGAQFAVGVKAFMVTVETMATEFLWLITMVWIISAVTDILISACLCFELYQRRKTALPSTAVMLDKIIFWTAETGLVTSVAAVALLICFLINKDNFVWLGIYFCFPRLFANCVIASLNSRSRLSAVREKENGFISLYRSQDQEISRNTSSQGREIAIQMTTITEAISDKDVSQSKQSRRLDGSSEVYV